MVELRAAIEGLEERFDQRLEQVDRRLDEMKADYGKRLDALQADNGSIKAEINDMKAEIKLLRWMVGAILTIVAGIGIRLLFM